MEESINTEEPTSTEIFDECIRILLRKRGYRCNKSNLEREIVVTFARGNYDTPSTVVIEVNGSPTVGRAIVSVGSGGPCTMSDITPPYIVVDNKYQRLTKIRSDSPKILSLSRLVNLAHRIDETRVVMRKVGDKLHFFKGAGDSLNFDHGDSGDKSPDETQN